MSRPTFSDAPEALVHDDPEVVPPKNQVTAGSSALRSPVKRVGDMKASSFWLLLGLVCILVIGITVGGAVGGSIAANKSHRGSPVALTLVASGSSTSSPSASTTSPHTSTSPLPSQPAGTPTSDCATIGNGTTYSSVFFNGDSGTVPPSAGLTFTRVCESAQSDRPLAEAYVLTFEACIEICAALNFWNNNKGCLGLTYEPTGIMPGNCWAHNVTTAVADSRYDSAVLVTS